MLIDFAKQRRIGFGTRTPQVHTAPTLIHESSKLVSATLISIQRTTSAQLSELRHARDGVFWTTRKVGSLPSQVAKEWWHSRVIAFNVSVRRTRPTLIERMWIVSTNNIVVARRHTTAKQI